MFVGRIETEFGRTARDAGYDLCPGERVPWLTVHGHVNPVVVQHAPPEVLAAVRRIFLVLGGDEERLATKRPGSDPRPDFRLHSHGGDGRILEIDEIQHFTTDRLQALKSYPLDTRLGYDQGEYIALCERWRTRGGDKYRAAKPTKEFARAGGRRAQRAYFDACRDLLASHLDAGSVIRVPAPECAPGLAFERWQCATSSA